MTTPSITSPSNGEFWLIATTSPCRLVPDDVGLNVWLLACGSSNQRQVDIKFKVEKLYVGELVMQRKKPISACGEEPQDPIPVQPIQRQPQNLVKSPNAAFHPTITSSCLPLVMGSSARPGQARLVDWIQKILESLSSHRYKFPADETDKSNRAKPSSCSLRFDHVSKRSVITRISSDWIAKQNAIELSIARLRQGLSDSWGLKFHRAG